ncbi:hypothetical protein, partial [Streptomyces sedi]
MSTSPSPFPVLWLSGPPGVGKSTAGWALYRRLAAGGTPVGYVDIDQLGINYPEPPGDPGRHLLKTGNLAALAANHRAHGARCLVVSGVVDPVAGVDRGRLPGVDLTLCALTAGREELSRRYRGRGTGPEHLARVLAEAECESLGTAAAGPPDVRVDTDGLAPAEVVERVLAHWCPPTAAPAPPPEEEAVGERERSDARVAVLLLCGAEAVGKSTVGWEVGQRLQRAGRPTAFVDLGQVGFLTPAPVDDPGGHRLRAANLAALLDRYAALGTRRLVAVGPVPDAATADLYRRALPGAALAVCRLDADPGTLLDRVRRRGAGQAPPLAGDRLR